MENKETPLQKNPSPESEDGNLFHTSEYDSGKVTKQVHQFYFVKLCPTDPDSISKIKEAERLVEQMNHDHLQISEMIREKMFEQSETSFTLHHLNYYHNRFIYEEVDRGRILNALHMALDELTYAKSNLNFLMLHGTRSLAKEKKILRETSLSQHRDCDPFSTLEELGCKISWNRHRTPCYKLENEIKQLQRQMANGNEASKGKIYNIGYWEKAITDQIKVLRDQALESRREKMAHDTKIRSAKKKREAINKVIISLQKKLTEKYQKKDEAYQCILKFKEMHDDEEMTNYYQFVSLMNHVHRPAMKKDIAALEEMSHSAIDKFMVAWNKNKAFREDYEKRVRQSLDIRQLSNDGRIKNQSH